MNDVTSVEVELDEIDTEVEASPLEAIIDDETLVSQTITGSRVKIVAPSDTSKLVVKIGDRAWELAQPELDLVGSDSIALSAMTALDEPAIASVREFVSSRLSGEQPRTVGERPQGAPAYEGLVKASDVETNPGKVGMLLAGALPMSHALERMTVRYFDLGSDSLLLHDGWVAARAVDYEISREPVGWAADDWIDTRVLGPYADSALADSTVGTAASRSQGEAITDSRDERQAQRGEAKSAETTTEHAGAKVTGKAVNAGLGGTREQSSTTAFTDPVRSLVETLTGTVQFGASWSNGVSQAEKQSAVERVLSDRFDRDLGFRRDGSASSGVQTTGTVRDTRSLLALRNLSDKSLNLATFSIARQWRVATVVADCRPVVLIPIDRVAIDFTTEDAFLHRTALATALLDRELETLLDRVAAGFGSTPAAPQPGEPEDQRVVQRITGKVHFSDPGKGRGSFVEIAVCFHDGQADHWPSQQLRETSVSTTYDVSIEVDRPLRRYGGARLTFVNPGIVDDELAVIESLQLNAVLADGSHVPLHEERDLRLNLREDPVLLPPRPADEPIVSATPAPAGPEATDATRLLAHLNQNRAYYRLAIDLRLDSATRFQRLAERARVEVPAMGVDAEKTESGATLPADLKKVLPIAFEPLGVVAGHIAFATAPDNLSEEERKAAGVGGAPSLVLTSTASSGVFAETILGERCMGAGASVANAPRLPSGPEDSNVTYPWPDRVVPSEAAVTTVLSQAAPAAPGTGPSAPAASTVAAPTTDVAEAARAAAEAKAGKSEGAEDTGKTGESKQNGDAK